MRPIFKFLLFYVLMPVLVFAFAAYFTISITLKGQKTAVCPDIRGKTVEEARTLVESKGLGFSILRYERRNDVAYNHVTIQKPDANISTRVGRIVYVIVSEGPELIKAPGFVGKTMEEARKLIEEKNLVLDRIITVPDARIGKIIAQIPAEGTEILQNGKLTFVVGGQSKIYFFMPDVRKTDATELAEDMELKNIKYRVNYARNEHTSGDIGFDVSIPSRTIFEGSDEVVINIY